MWVVRRLLQTFVLSLLLSFVLMAMLGAMPERVPDDEDRDLDRVERIRGRDLGLWTRYRCWWMGRDQAGCAHWPSQGLLQGDLGFSWVYRRPLAELLPRRLAASASMVGPALVLAVVLAIGLGLGAAYRESRGRGRGTEAVLLVGSAFPLHWLGLLTLWVGAVQLRWFPVAPGPESALRAVLPGGVLVVFYVVRWARYVRAQALEVLQEDHILAARARGVGSGRLWMRHVLPAAVVPLVALVAQSVPVLLSGVVVLETVFSYPGMGRLLFESIVGDDALTAVTVFFFYAVTTFACALVADLVLQLLDPRVEMEQTP